MATIADVEDKEAVLQAGHRGVFTITHFDGHPAVLLRLPTVTKKVLRELLIDGWLAVAPDSAATEYLARRRR